MDNICHTVSGEQCFVFNPEQELQFHELNDSASILWSVLDQPQTITVLAEKLCEVYGGQHENYIADIRV